ncbi:hypothetical protein C8D88_105506 [Lentzea atacamensis]|uniref:Uncharacterized protein n=2 Tax=Lentzea atacamensis TaxID=531938 RepID=A0A316I183_9PSEU|nr:hypothetical protein C8D88_105506 [Lentzea atacamensis]RAS59837.1 hypothetical protein C8D87_113143 [Lentzea atacamensis]
MFVPAATASSAAAIAVEQISNGSSATNHLPMCGQTREGCRTGPG